MTTGYSLYPHSILSTFSLMTIHENDGILDEEPRTWTRSVGTKNRSSRITGPRSGTKNEFSSEDGGPMTVNVVFISVQRFLESRFQIRFSGQDSNCSRILTLIQATSPGNPRISSRFFQYKYPPAISYDQSRSSMKS